MRVACPGGGGGLGELVFTVLTGLVDWTWTTEGGGQVQVWTLCHGSRHLLQAFLCMKAAKTHMPLYAQHVTKLTYFLQNFQFNLTLKRLIIGIVGFYLTSCLLFSVHIVGVFLLFHL